VLVIDDPRRSRQSRAVEAYFGLLPRLDGSRDVLPQLRITNERPYHFEVSDVP
jgi:hypothetical protein